MNTDDPKNNKFSQHAMKRAQQRGVKDQTVDIIIEFADKKVPVKDNRLSLTVSKKRLKSLVLEGTLDAQMAEKIADVAVIMAEDGEVVSVLHAEDGAKGRHYRKNVKPSRRQKKR